MKSLLDQSALTKLAESLVSAARKAGADAADAVAVRSVSVGVEVREAESVPMKLAIFDGQEGMIALLDPVITKPTWTAVVSSLPSNYEF